MLSVPTIPALVALSLPSSSGGLSVSSLGMGVSEAPVASLFFAVEEPGLAVGVVVAVGGVVVAVGGVVVAVGGVVVAVGGVVVAVVTGGTGTGAGGTGTGAVVADGTGTGAVVAGGTGTGAVVAGGTGTGAGGVDVSPPVADPDPGISTKIGFSQVLSYGGILTIVPG